METTPFNEPGVTLWPAELDPQATIVPSDLSARLEESPAAIATTPFSPAGTPKPTTVPSDLSAKLSLPPDAIATIPVNPLNILGEPPLPQATTVPSDLSARLEP